MVSNGRHAPIAHRMGNQCRSIVGAYGFPARAKFMAGRARQQAEDVHAHTRVCLRHVAEFLVSKGDVRDGIGPVACATGQGSLDSVFGHGSILKKAPVQSAGVEVEPDGPGAGARDSPAAGTGKASMGHGMVQVSYVATSAARGILAPSGPVPVVLPAPRIPHVRYAGFKGTTHICADFRRFDRIKIRINAQRIRRIMVDGFRTSDQRISAATSGAYGVSWLDRLTGD